MHLEIGAGDDECPFFRTFAVGWREYKGPRYTASFRESGVLRDMDEAIYDELQRLVQSQGPRAAVEHLIGWLRGRRDFTSLFYALLMKARLELGVSPIPTGAAKDLPEAIHGPYEEAIRSAGREVGGLCLQEGNIPQAWAYFRMLGEPGPVKEALETHKPGPDEEIQNLVQVAFYEGVHPRKGFDWILERHGICNSITTLSGSQELNHPPDVRQYCIRRLAHALYNELRERLAGEIKRHEGKDPRDDRADMKVTELMAGRDYLFEEFAHIDVSHLSAVTQMSIQLEPGQTLELARELCVYGDCLPKKLRYQGEEPFDDQYKDYGIYLAILAGENVEEGIAHFRKKAANADPDLAGTYPAQVLVNLLVRLGRVDDAVEVSRRYLASTSGQQLACPSLVELCQMAGNFQVLSETARAQGDSVHYLAGLLAGGVRASKAD
jgi:hypothetical protein